MDNGWIIQVGKDKDACNTEQCTAISHGNVVQNPLLRAFIVRRLGVLFNHHNDYTRCLFHDHSCGGDFFCTIVAATYVKENRMMVACDTSS